MKKVIIFMLYVCTLISVFSCRLDQSALVLFTGDFSPPKLENIAAVSSDSVDVKFSKQVSLISAHLSSTSDPDFRIGKSLEDVSSWQSNIEWNQEENVIHITIPQELNIGEEYVLSGVVEDEKHNSLLFESRFTGYNNRIPVLLLSEIRTEYTKPKVEFIELYAATAGNLGGVRLISCADGENRSYTFAPMEIPANSFIVLHYRSIEDGLINEVKDPGESGGTDALQTAYDFWREGAVTALPKTDVILLEERKGGSLLDALVYRESKNIQWTKPELEKAALRAFTEGVWNTDVIEGSVLSDNTTTTRTISRQLLFPIHESFLKKRAASRDEWIIVDSSQATPGKQNSAKAYIKK